MDKRKIVIVGLVLGSAYLLARRNDAPQIRQLPGYDQPQITDLYSGIRDIQPEQPGAVEQFFQPIIDAGEFIMSSLSGTRGYTAMRNVDKSLVNHPQVKAFLAVIRRGEGTADSGGYNRLFGGGTFDSYAWHPNILVKKSGYSSTAAGAYQFLKSTWDETAQAMGLRDFSPISQDIGALGRIAWRGALSDVLAGRFVEALKKTSKEWASLPYSPYGQPVISYQTALATFKNAGGQTGVMV